MAFRITFFRLPKPRRFNYSPIYYDPIKERIEEARARAANDERPYQPGQRIRGSFQKAYDDKRRPSGNSLLIRVVIYLTVIVLFLFIWYFTDGMTLLFKGLNNQPVP